MQLPLLTHPGYHLSPLAPTDRVALIAWLNDPMVSHRTLNIPFPYTVADADWWIAHREVESIRKLAPETSFALRDPSGLLLGAIGADSYEPSDPIFSHRTEIGYWLARPYWGMGLMPAAVSALVTHLFASFPHLHKITATIFLSNAPSRRVLEKSGFRCEAALLRDHYRKNGLFEDAQIYSVLRPEWPVTKKIEA